MASSSVLCAEEPSSKEPIVVNGDKVEYFHEKKIVIGTGNISITYKDVVLTCDKITVHLDTREAEAEGNVKITQKDAYFTGDALTYNFDTRKGRATNGYINYEPFYGKAQEMDKVSDKQVNLKRGYVTTCDLEKPHYRVQARQVKIFLDDKVTAKHVLFFIGNVPVLYIPYYVQLLKERTAHISVLLGKNRDWGNYALTALKYYFSEICKGRFLLDYRTKKGLAEGIDNYYSIKGFGSGTARFYYTNENDILAYAPSGEVESKWRAQVRHKWEMNEDTLAIFEFNTLRDQNFIKDYFYKEYEEEGQPDNYLSFITTKDNYSSTFLIRKRMDRYFTVVERLPEFSMSIENQRINDAMPIYYKSDLSGVYLNKTFEKLTSKDKDITTIRFDAYSQFSYAAKLLNFLRVTPFLGTEQTFYSRNRWGDTNLIRGALKGGIDISTKFYKIYDVTTDFLGLDIHKLRHIITPTANYYYTHQPTISPDNLHQFDSVDALSATNGVILALENKLQTKRLENDKLKSVDLATFIISSDYGFRLKKNAVDYKTQKFKTVDLRLELVPYPWLYILSKMTIDTKRYTVESESVDLVADGGERWFLGVGHRYENVATGKSNLFTLDTRYKINDKWEVGAYGRFNVEGRYLEEHEYAIYRDLHCWRAELTYNIQKEKNDRTLWLVFRLKAFPESPIGFKRVYSRPQFGSTGASNDRYNVTGSSGGYHYYINR